MSTQLTDYQRHIIRIATENLLVVRDQIQSMVEDKDTTFDKALKALDNAKQEMGKL